MVNKITEIINKYILKENYYFLNRVFDEAMKKNDKEKTKEILIASFESRLIKNKEIVNAHIYSEYWTFLSVNFPVLSTEEKSIVIDLIIKVERYNSQNTMDFYSILNQYYYIDKHTGSADEKLAAWKPIFSYGLDLDVFNKIQDNEVYLLWIIYILSKNTIMYREELNIHKLPKVDFNNVELETKIIALIQDIPSLSPIEDILKFYKEAQLLFLLLKKEKLNIESLTNNSFYKIKFIQKMFVYLDNNGVRYPTAIEKVINEIDYTDKCFGSELNLFLKNHPEISSKKDTLDEYINGISSIRSYDVVNQPFLKAEELKKLSVEEIIEKLNNVNLENKEIVNSHTVYSFSVEGQNEELISFFEEEPIKGEEIVEALLQNETLKVSYSKIISIFLENNLNKSELINKYIESLEKDNIEYETYKIFRALTEVNTELVYDFLESLNYTVFEQQFLENIKDEQFIDINYFGNSNIGKFYEILRRCISKSSNGEHRLILYINKTTNSFLKQYLCGMLCEFLPNDMILATFNSFQGMSHFYSIGKDTSSFYKNTVIDILHKGSEDSFLKQNVLFTMISEIFPDSDIDVSEINEEFLQSLLPELYRAYLQLTTFNENIYNWLLEIIKKTELSSSLLENIIRSCVDCNGEELTRIDKIISKIEDNKLVSSKKIGLYSIEYEAEEINKDMSSLRIQKFNVFIKVLILLFKNNIIRIDYSSYKQIDNIMHIIDQEELFERNKALYTCIRKFLPAVDSETLGRKYLRI
ncbi:hypothetical protein [Bacillus cereus]|uniref:hypothetical protein n=3 Tax=Bacillus cereus TaxID=1396 RepID=UPI000BFB9D8D|nr:hypothetical protein [Bacillus cereus]PGN93361.1 hypothetical protein CN965_14490 [Bacillus cereus]PGX88648.1 hypothetical protein COE28_01965 [Bacillus cereus]